MHYDTKTDNSYNHVVFNAVMERMVGNLKPGMVVKMGAPQQDRSRFSASFHFTNPNRVMDNAGYVVNVRMGEEMETPDITMSEHVVGGDVIHWSMERLRRRIFLFVLRRAIKKNKALGGRGLSNKFLMENLNFGVMDNVFDFVQDLDSKSVRNTGNADGLMWKKLEIIQETTGNRFRGYRLNDSTYIVELGNPDSPAKYGITFDNNENFIKVVYNVGGQWSEVTNTIPLKTIEQAIQYAQNLQNNLG